MEGFCVWRSIETDTDDEIVEPDNSAEEEHAEFNFSENWNDAEDSSMYDVVEESPMLLHSGNPVCSICVNQTCSIFLHPCDHQLCARCASRLEHCPFCRSHIAGVVEDLTMY